LTTALAGGGAAVGAVVLATGSTASTTYGGVSTILLALTLVAGLGLIVAGSITSLRQSAGRIPELAVLAGFAWFAPVWVAWQDGPPLVRSLATVLAGFTFPLVVHLVLASPDGRVGQGASRALVAVVYAETLAATLLLALFRDPYFDSSCWSNCTANSFLIRSYPSLTHAVVTADRWFVAGGAVALAVICAARLARGSLLARFRLAATSGPGIVFAVGVIVRSIALQQTGIDDPFDALLRTAFALQGVALALLTVGLIAGVARVRRERRAVARVVADLDEAPTPGSVQAALAEALGEPELRVAYHVGDGLYVDAVGHEVEAPEPVPGKGLTRLNRNGHTIAVIAHAGMALERPIGPALLLALENERLQADLLAKLEELRASRARVVETADAERRRLERDLHDGAQQRLLALSFDIRLAKANAEAEGDTGAERELVRALEQTQAVLEELRKLAHGIYPAILAEAGLGPALATLADGAPLPVEIVGVVPRRYPTPVETTAYFTVVEAVDDAARRGADYAIVSVLEAGGRLVVSVEDSGSDRTSPLAGLADRVGALGGDIAVEPTCARAEIPCL
jgi:signal transduction histidine kinase